MSRIPPRGFRHRQRDQRARWDIQGLRAVAVLAVVANHLFGWPRGGFVGVDVFFVISGFLITGLLLREYEKAGSISFAGFYRRRIKRIIPALVLVLSATVVASWFIFSSPRWRTTAIDSLWSLLSVGNWRFSIQSADYFQQDRPVSPVQHFWSLGVEEQFYLVWPWLMLLIFLAVRRRTRHNPRVAVGITIGAVSIASFVWALYGSQVAPERAYFSTLTRTWELGLGAIVAIAAPAFAALPRRLRPVLAWLGLSAIAVSLIVVRPDAGFPAPAAALPVVATALIIAAGTGVTQQRSLWPLTNRISCYVGDISYSLYLWHFPVIILGGVVLGAGPVQRASEAIAMTLAAVFTFHLLEDPVRRSGWLTTPRSGGKTGRRRAPRRRAWLTPTYKVMTLSLVLIVNATLVAVAIHVQSVPTAAAPIPQSTVVAMPSNTASPKKAIAPQQAALSREIVAALSATQWPKFNPSLDTIARGEQPAGIGNCGFNVVPEAECQWGDPGATHTAIMVGDSISMAYVAALRAAIGTKGGWRLISYGGYGCTFIGVDLDSQTDTAKDCSGRKDRAVEAVNRLKPDVVFVSNYPGLRTAAGADRPMTLVDQEAAYRAQLNKLTGEKSLVILAAPPNEKSVEFCYTKTSKPGDCVSQVTSNWLGMAAAEREMAVQIKAEYVDSRDWFCVDGNCPSFVGSVTTKKDFVHMTPEYAEHIAPAILEKLNSQGILRLTKTRGK